MQKIIEIEGKKYLATSIEDKDENLLDSFSPSFPSSQPEIPEEPVELVDATPKIKGPLEMMKETAARITEARVNKMLEGAKVRNDYDTKIGREVSNPKFYYGEGAADVTGGEEEV
jgi:hypothetical protein